MTKSDERVERTRAEALDHLERIGAAGGNLSYCIAYIRHVTDLSGDGEPVVLRERRAAFPRMAVQIAAVSALEAARDGDMEPDTRLKAETLARTAWVCAAGHFVDQPSGGDDCEVVAHPDAQAMQMIRKGADKRKARAAEQWDRLAGDRPGSLRTLALFGHESAPAPTRKDWWKAFAAMVVAVLMVSAYFASHWYLSVKVTAPYDTQEGLIQRRAATERFRTYDEFMSSHVRNGGLIKLFLDWPMSPTQAEVDAFVEYATDIVQMQHALVEQKMICGKAKMDDEHLLALINAVNDEIDPSGEAMPPFTHAQSVILQALSRLYPPPC
ncbi:hypothetical protein [Aureimonas frigidaquae]|uniref:hypothetical protein n=1 Tax=Aureimonas frigidaquae TaxID=424757 RepID=UPI000780F5E5|nr:hypothetical protein [Aureimonas frigidaquae]